MWGLLCSEGFLSQYIENGIEAYTDLVSKKAVPSGERPLKKRVYKKNIFAFCLQPQVR